MQTYYHPFSRFLHWLMAGIFVFVWFVGLFAAEVFSGSTRGALLGLHKNLAATLIFLVVVRLFWRYTHPAPKLPENMGKAMKGAAHAGHLLLYLLLIAMPVSGILLSWSAGRDVSVLYLLPLPTLMEENDDFFLWIEPVHVYLAWFSALMVVGHVVMAVKHHIVDKDGVLLSMMGPRKHGKKTSD